MTQSTTGTAAAHPLPSPKERRRLREAKSLSEEQVAAAVGVTRATVRAWETGRTSPRGRKREAYARLIGSAVPPEPAAGTSVQPAPPSPPPESRPPTPVAATGSVAKATTEPGTAPEPPGVVAETGGTGPTGGAAQPDEPGGSGETGERGEVIAVTVATAAVVTAGDDRDGRDGRDGREDSDSDSDDGEGAGTGAAAEAGVDGAAEARAEADTEADAETGADADADADADAGPTPAEAFDALYRHTAAALFRQTYLLTGRRGLSREAVAKAFDLAWQRWPEVAVDRDPVGWVRAAAYEHAMSPWHQLRREHRHPDPPPEAPGPRALLDALLALPPSYRRTLLLHDGVGLGLPETAAETEASTPATAGRLMTARAAVAEQLPELAKPASPDEQSALLHEKLGALALAQPASSLPVPELIRTGSERKAQLWTRAAIAFTVLLIGLTLITLATAPRKYETPQSPAQQVGGVPPLGGPQKLTPQDKKLQKKLGGELVNGPGRLVPGVR
ncbi:helix-turn-helix domain-containing protein [Streptomyces sp. NPDC058382]|uniref:helix-turn-helix domain-containing protein n=1 Tax=unclassified Streptomyces TaxID=2593676 RepID=UPI0036440562